MSLEESLLQEAIMTAIKDTAMQNAEILKMLKIHIGMGLQTEAVEDKSLEIQIKITEADAKFKTLLEATNDENKDDSLIESELEKVLQEKKLLGQQLEQYEKARQHRENTKSRIEGIFTVLDGLKNHPITYDDQIVRQIIDCVVVESKEKIKIVFIGGLEVEQAI